MKSKNKRSYKRKKKNKKFNERQTTQTEQGVLLPSSSMCYFWHLNCNQLKLATSEKWGKEDNFYTLKIQSSFSTAPRRNSKPKIIRNYNNLILYETTN